MPAAATDHAASHRIVSRLVAGFVVLAATGTGCSAGRHLEENQPPTGPQAFLIFHFGERVPCDDPRSDTRCRQVAVANTGTGSGTGTSTLFPVEGSTAEFGDGETTVAAPELAPGASATVGIAVIGRGKDGEFRNPMTWCAPGPAMA